MGRLHRDRLSSLKGLSPPCHPSFLSEARGVSSCSSSCAGSSSCCNSRAARDLPGGAGGTPEVADPKGEGDSRGDVPPLGFSHPHLPQESSSTRGWPWAGGARGAHRDEEEEEELTWSSSSTGGWW